ncbi:hypothetical protein L3X38_017119 [Prunus dulcis]|uniref:Uncharacterized protein n=1 Tax=Prunus dulcis TaxID=3755 RepID=A0AAD4W6P9_PRUDU|nr:hypothetical protein L3X38_017119 [Prunus dulcis]
MATETSQSPSPIVSSPSSTNTTTSLITINAAAQLPIKLTPLNYPSWWALFNAFLLGYDLMGYVDEIYTPSPPSIASSPSYPHALWTRQDQLLLHAILALVSEQVISLIASAKTSKAAWDKLSQLFANRTRSRVISLKERLTLTRHDSKPATAYLQTVKAISDELALIDAPVTDDDLVIHILNGVSPEFKELAAGARARESSISFEELHEKLVEYEAALQCEDTHTASPVITANINQQPHSSLPHRESSGTTSFNHSPSNTTQFRHSYNTFGTGYRGFCQICDQ